MPTRPYDRARTSATALATLALVGTTLVGCTTGVPVPPSSAPASEAPESTGWSYTGATGPDNWSDLDPVYASCGDLSGQSPIDLPSQTATPEAEPTTATLSDSVVPGAFLETEDGVRFLPDTPAFGLVLDDTDLTFIQGHLHTPAEHTLEGRQAQAELHLVHESEAGDIAVVAILLTDSTHHSAAGDALAGFAAADGTPATLDLTRVLPTERSTQRYEGSLTTPPCTPGVDWVVLTEPVDVGTDQLATIGAGTTDNARPVQPDAGRVVTPSSLVAPHVP